MGASGSFSGSTFYTKGRVIAATTLFAFAAVLAFVLTGSAQAQNGTFSNGTQILIPGNVANTSGRAAPYPSTINVSGMTGNVSDVDVTLTSVAHTNPDDIDALLVGPAGQNVRLVSDSGGTTDVTGVNLTLDDEAAGSSLPDSAEMISGTYQPTNHGSPVDDFTGSGASEPTPGYGAALSVFDGTNPNGDWKLYVVDDAGSTTFPNTGKFAGGWSISISTDNDPPVITAATGGTADEGSPATITVEATDAQNDTLTYSFDCNYDGDYEDPIDTDGQSINEGSCAFDDNGSYTVGVKVSDGKANGTDTDAATVTVANVPPSISLAGEDEATEGEATEGDTKAYEFAVTDDGAIDTHEDGLVTACGGPNAEKVGGSQSYDPETRTGGFECRFLDGGPEKTSAVTATVTDDDGDSDTSEQSITVEIANADPTIDDIENLSIDENTGTGTLSFTVGDVDADTPLTVTGESSNEDLVPDGEDDENIVITGDGSDRAVTVTPVADENGEATVTLTVSDEDGGSASDSFDLTVRPVNARPTAVPVTPDAVNEADTGNEVEIDLTTGASDEETLDANLAYAIEDPTPGEGALTRAEENGEPVPGVFVFDPARDFNTGNGALDLEYTVTDRGDPDGCDPADDTDDASNEDGCDSAKTSDPGLISIDVNPVADDPIANDDPTDGDTLETNRGEPLANIAVLANDTDADGDAISVFDFTDPVDEGGDVAGTLTKNPDDTFTFTPNSSFFGIATFTYRAKDFRGTDADAEEPNGVSDEAATVAVEVIDDNDAPTAANDAYSVDEDGTLTADDADGAAESPNDANNDGVLANDTDPNDDTLAATLVEGPESGTLGLEADGAFEYTPDGDFNGSDSFTYRADDGGEKNNLSEPVTVSITVEAMNDAPSASSASRATDEDGDNVSIDLSTLVSDVETDDADLAYALADGSPSGASLSGSTLTYDPAQDFNTGNPAVPVEIEYTVTDRGDPDDCDDTVAENCDGTEKPAGNSVSVTVHPVNDAPTAGAASATTDEEEFVDIDVLAADGTGDVDGDALTILLPSGTTPNGSVSIVDNPGSQGSGKVIRYTPNTNFRGSDSFTYKVTDGALESEAATVTVNVANVNDAPTARPDTATTSEGTPVSIAVLENDEDSADGDDLAIESFTNPVDARNNVVGTVARGDGGVLVFTPNANFVGAATFTYTITDGATGETATVTVTVTATDDAPSAAPDAYETPEDTPLVVAAPGVLDNDTDPDNEGSSNAGLTVADGDNDPENGITPVAGPTKGSLALDADGSFTYTPNANANGSDSFTYRTTDGGLTSEAATVSIAVAAVNDKPIAADDVKSTPENTPLVFPADDLRDNDRPGPAAATDEQNQTLTVTGASQAVRGTVSLANGQITFAPEANYSGPASFKYTVCDSGSPQACATMEATVNVAISAVNSAPAANAITRTMDEDDAPISINLADHASDDETLDEDLAFALTQSPAAEGTANLEGSTLSFDPASNFHGVVNLRYSVTDTGDGSASPKTTEAEISITVTPVNDAPTAGAVDAVVREDEASNIDVLAETDDVDGDALAVVAVSQPGKGAATVNSDGTVRYAPRANLTGGDRFTYKVTDGSLESETATVDVEITAVNDAPTVRNDASRTRANRAVTIDVLANDSDVDGDTLSVASFSPPTRGTVARGGDGTLKYTPPNNFIGLVFFSYRATDGAAKSDLGFVVVVVTR